MRLGAVLGAFLALAAMTVTVAAFEETPVVPSTGAPAAGADGGLGLTTPDQPAVEPDKGGLGGIGILPKLDFGLELLYSSEDTGSGETVPDSAQGSEDFTLRGALKHEF